jgi:hypothetical protein
MREHSIDYHRMADGCYHTEQSRAPCLEFIGHIVHYHDLFHQSSFDNFFDKSQVCTILFEVVLAIGFVFKYDHECVREPVL